MQLGFRSLLVLALAAVPAASVLVPSDAEASVSIAVGFEALVKDADAVVVVSPIESSSVWEEGRIATYTKVKIDQPVAGAFQGSEGYIRTMGGVVGKIGQLVDGEPVFTVGKSSLVFLHKFKASGTWEVSARGQGQFPVVLDDVSKARKTIRSSSSGLVLPPKANTTTPSTGIAPQSANPPRTTVEQSRLAQDVLHERPLDDVTREIAETFKRLHPVSAPAK